jgi:hypothetical protein
MDGFIEEMEDGSFVLKVQLATYNQRCSEVFGEEQS